MEIITTKQYIKQFEKLQKASKISVKKSIIIFQENPLDPKLNNHALKGKFKGYRSIDAEFDLRIIFREENGYEIVAIVQVGTHSQLYG
jgi:addiction module RelE/StbE family toxin